MILGKLYLAMFPHMTKDVRKKPKENYFEGIHAPLTSVSIYFFKEKCGYLIVWPHITMHSHMLTLSP
jgi:phosphatidylserine synthase